MSRLTWAVGHRWLTSLCRHRRGPPCPGRMSCWRPSCTCPCRRPVLCRARVWPGRVVGGGGSRRESRRAGGGVGCAGGAAPPLPLARLRARGQLAELRAADLRFTDEEAAALLGETVGPDLPSAAAQALVARTEGW